jgi:AraC-like DNA-binding protein
VTTPRGRPEAILRPGAAAQAFDVERVPPREALAEYVDYHWLVRWEVPVPFRQQVVPQPRVHLAAESGRLLVHGLSREPFFRTLVGRGHVVGTAFHPAGFRAFLRTSLATIRDTVRPAGELLGADDRPAAETALGTHDTATAVAAVEDYLQALGPEPDPLARRLNGLVDLVATRADLIRAEQLAEEAGVSLRTLQRQFTEYLGIGPKWVIQRSRILDAAAAAHEGRPPDWAALALELGFSDQAHLTRVFTHVVGSPPATYRRDAGLPGDAD